MTTGNFVALLNPTDLGNIDLDYFVDTRVKIITLIFV